MAYKSSFIPGYSIPLPVIPPSWPVAPLLRGNGQAIDYHHHSVVLNRKRRFAYYSASNIDGNTWEPIDRQGSFAKDTQNMDAGFQLGDELYAAITGRGRKNDFDEGHLTSFQEVLWGSPDDMKQAGEDTFFFTNCMPQHSLLNRGAWKSLEQYITKKGADQNDVKVCVFTGPVFSDKDPFFIKEVEDQLIRIPTTFWKIIYYRNALGLNAVGFMMSHENLLLEEGTVTYDREEVEERGVEGEEEDVFMKFPKATTYQVKVELIQKITKLPFHLDGVSLPYQQEGSKEIVYKRIEVERSRSLTPVPFKDEPLDYKLEGLAI